MKVRVLDQIVLDHLLAPSCSDVLKISKSQVPLDIYDALSTRALQLLALARFVHSVRVSMQFGLVADLFQILQKLYTVIFFFVLSWCFLAWKTALITKGGSRD